MAGWPVTRPAAELPGGGWDAGTIRLHEPFGRHGAAYITSYTFLTMCHCSVVAYGHVRAQRTGSREAEAVR